MQKVNAHSMEKALGAVLEDEHQIAATIARAHDETCDYTRDKVTPLLEAARARPIYAECPPQMVSYRSVSQQLLSCDLNRNSARVSNYFSAIASSIHSVAVFLPSYVNSILSLVPLLLSHKLVTKVTRID